MPVNAEVVGDITSSFGVQEILSRKHLRVKNARIEDAVSWLTFLCHLDAETDFMLFEEGERNPDIAKCEQAIRRINEVRGAILLLVEDASNNIVGYFKGDVLPLGRKAHVMGLSCALLKSYRGDTGKALLRYFMNEVERQGIIKRIEGSVMASNVRMLLVVLSLGAVIEGLKRNSIRVRGQMIDEYVIAKYF